MVHGVACVLHAGSGRTAVAISACETAITVPPRDGPRRRSAPANGAGGSWADGDKFAGIYRWFDNSPNAHGTGDADEPDFRESGAVPQFETGAAGLDELLVSPVARESQTDLQQHRARKRAGVLPVHAFLPGILSGVIQLS